jgi:hypothetical protein
MKGVFFVNKIVLSNQEIFFIEKNVAGTLAIENCYPSISGRIITRNFLSGKITSEKAIKKILMLYGVKI